MNAQALEGPAESRMAGILRQHTATVLAVATSAYSVSRLLVIAHLNLATTSTVLTQTGISNILIGTVTSSIILLVALAGPIFAWLVLLHPGRYPIAFVLAFVAIALASTFVTPWPIGVFTLVVALIFAIVHGRLVAIFRATVREDRRLSRALDASEKQAASMVAEVEQEHSKVQVEAAVERLKRAIRAANAHEAKAGRPYLDRKAQERLARLKDEVAREKEAMRKNRQGADELLAATKGLLSNSYRQRALIESRAAAATRSYRDHFRWFRYPIGAVSIALAIGSLFARPWWPAENLTTQVNSATPSEVRTAYVVAIADGWVTLLTYGDSQVEYLPEDELVGRENCSTPWDTSEWMTPIWFKVTDSPAPAPLASCHLAN